MKRFRKLHSSLNPAEVCAGAGNLDNGKILDVGFHYLGFMGLERLNFFVEGIGNIHKYMRLKILGCGAFIK